MIDTVLKVFVDPAFVVLVEKRVRAVDDLDNSPRTGRRIGRQAIQQRSVVHFHFAHFVFIVVIEGVIVVEPLQGVAPGGADGRRGAEAGPRQRQRGRGHRPHGLVHGPRRGQLPAERGARHGARAGAVKRAAPRQGAGVRSANRTALATLSLFPR